MSDFFTPQTATVDLGDGNTATLRKLSYGDVLDVMSLAQGDGFKAARLQLERGIVAWAGPGFAGRELTPENIAALPARVGRKLQAAFTELNAEMDTDEGN